MDRKAGRDPHADRPARHRQDLDRRVDRPRDRTRVRAHVARRRPRRGRDPRPPAHVHRRPAGTARPCPARRRDDEPGDHARRGRQGRRRLARRPVGGAARGPRPRAEPRLPRSLPRHRDRPVARSCSSPRRTSPRRSRGRCSTAWRSSASTATPWPRRRRSPATTCGRASASATGLREDEVVVDDEIAEARRERVHPRGGRAPARARARDAAAQDRDEDRLGDGRARR